MSSPVDQMRVVREVIAVWDAMGIPYAIGGSLASSVHGTPRYTLDADMTVEPFPGREPEFCRHFGGAYYVSLPAVVEAVHRRSTFNIIDTLAGFKVDVYVRKDRGFEQSVMSRRRILPLGDPPVFDAVVVSPEDIVLLKLEWYRLGGEISDRQWLDVLGVLRVQAPDLDRSYLTQWAEPLGVRDLLDRAVSEADSP